MMPNFVVTLSISGSAEEIEGVEAAIRARLPQLGEASDVSRPVVYVDADSSADASRFVSARIDSLPPHAMDRIRVSTLRPDRLLSGHACARS
jgi:hypothetical protein